MTFIFGDTVLDPERLELQRRGVREALEPQAFDVLVYLVNHRDRVVSKEELMDEVWGGRFVSETAVTSRIKQARRALGDDGQSQSCIRTYHGRGYRFVAEVLVGHSAETSVRSMHAAGPLGGAGSVEARVDRGLADPDNHDGLAAPPDAPVMSFSSGGRRGSYQLSGQGPPDLLLLPASGALNGDWDRPERARWLHALGNMARVIRYQAPGLTPVEGDDVVELLSVLDTAASHRAVVLAEDAGVALATRLASSRPERVAGLVLFGAALETAGTSPTSSGLGLLGSIEAPTLVLHRVGDAVVPIAAGRAVAAAIPDAEFVTLDGSEHDAALGNSGQALGEMGDFIRELAAADSGDRSLNALVGLNGGDITLLASVLVQLGGRLRQGPEQSVIVSFDGPANALKALASRRARGLRSEVGIGLAIDEIPRDALLVSGHGVDVARLFARYAEPGEVLLPNVIRHLLAGSGLRVETLTPLDLPHVGLHPVHRWIAPR